MYAFNLVRSFAFSFLATHLYHFKGICGFILSAFPWRFWNSRSETNVKEDTKRLDLFSLCRDYVSILLKIFKLEILGILVIANFWNFLSWKINKLLEFFEFGKPKFGSKNWQFWNRPCRKFADSCIFRLM